MPLDPQNPLKLSFKAAISWFRRRLSIPSKDWKTVQDDENQWAFAVAGIQNAEMLADIRAALDRYLADGTGFQQFSKEFKQISERYGWQPKEGVAWRANIVASTNLRQAYAVGQLEQRQNPAVKALRPGVKWVHRDSPIPRPHHLALDGKVFDGNDPEYANLTAPSGWGCRCVLRSVPAPRNGYFTLSDRLPYTLPTGETVSIPAIPVAGKLYPIAEKGFYRSPQQSRTDDRIALLKQMIERQPVELRAKILEGLPEEVKGQLSLI